MDILFHRTNGHLMKKLTKFILSISIFLFSLDSALSENRLLTNCAKPVYSSSGIIFTNGLSNGLYQIRDGKTEELITGPGVGSYFVISPEGDRIGLKIITADGFQIPALLLIGSKTLIRLYEPVSYAGQISFSRNGKITFTVGNSLVVLEGEKKTVVDLGTYSNLAPISPDGEHIIYNDRDDQLWLMNYKTGTKTKITPDRSGSMHPVWSPDGFFVLYSSLAGEMFIYQLASGKILSLGFGDNPVWSPDSKYILFTRRGIQKDRCINSDIFLVSAADASTIQLTDTPDRFEMDAQFAEDGSKILFREDGTSEICIAELSVMKEFPERVKIKQRFQTAIVQPRESFAPESLHPGSNPDQMEKVSTIDMPYVHQCYDTPDWHNGNGSCAPTAASMVLAYFNILPKWETSCSTPYWHTNDWGNYIANKYQFKEVNYGGYQTTDYGGKNLCWGGYAFMWQTGSPHTRMASYFRNHGIEATQSEAPPYSEAVTELNAGYPYTLCVLLTTAGHLVVALGIAGDHTLIFNDPYGNKNSGYMNYSGKNVKYDWPGYNNGYQNLNQVAWCISTHYTPVAPADSIVDDLQFDKGFYLHTKSPSSMTLWKDKNQGYRNHFWYATTRLSNTVDTCYATWKPVLAEDGQYEVFAYIPFSTATAARYKIYHKNGLSTVVLNQKPCKDSLVSLGTFEFLKGNTGYVRLGDGSDTSSQNIVFDAIQWKYRSPLTGIDRGSNTPPLSFSLGQNYPNPFNGITNYELSITNEGQVRIKVFDLLGKECATIVNGKMVPGTYRIQWDAGNLPSGIYFYQLEMGNYHTAQKMVLVR
jgi:hypothetical protein